MLILAQPLDENRMKNTNDWASCRYLANISGRINLYTDDRPQVTRLTPTHPSDRLLKDQLFTQVAALSKAIANPKRLEIIELLAQSDKTVEQLANETHSSVALISAHLKALKQARLVQVTQDGKYRRYALSNIHVAHLWVALHRLASAQLPELKQQLQQMQLSPSGITQLDTLISLARQQQIQLIDVRPETEYTHAHLPYAQSIPLEQLTGKAQTLNKHIPVIAYCRGPFCLYAREAVIWLTQQGFIASQWQDGVIEYQTDQLTTS